MSLILTAVKNLFKKKERKPIDYTAKNITAKRGAVVTYNGGIWIVNGSTEDSFFLDDTLWSGASGLKYCKVVPKSECALADIKAS